MITLVQNIQLRFYKNSEDLRMFREEVQIGVMWRVLRAVMLSTNQKRSLFCLHQSEAITDHRSACTNQKRSRITVLPAPITYDHENHGSLWKITVIGNERDRITRDSQITVLAKTKRNAWRCSSRFKNTYQLITSHHIYRNQGAARIVDGEDEPDAKSGSL